MSVPANALEFLELVRKSGLVDAPDLARYNGSPLSGDAVPEPRQMAESLVRDGVLTMYQAGLLLKGRWRNFMVAGKYRVLDHLGTGGMGSVYLCEHTVMRRRVALKVLPNKGGPTALERFKREARAVAALDHPNIVRAHDIDQAGPLTFLVMEYVDGRSLQALIAKIGPLSIERACHYIAQAAYGLQHAHEAGLVHRDIKPGNLLLARDGTVKVLDLGLARFTEHEDDNLTREHEANLVLGTADYLAPEQAIDSSAVDIRADVYSLGATFYFLLTARSPVGEGTLSQKLIRHQMRRVPSVREVRPEVPEELAAILERLLAKEPGDRFQTPIEVAQVLEPWTAGDIELPSSTEMPPRTDNDRRSDAVRATDATRPMGSAVLRAKAASRPGSSVVLTPPPVTELVPAPTGEVRPPSEAELQKESKPEKPARRRRSHGILIAMLLTFLLGGLAVVGGLYALGMPLFDSVPTLDLQNTRFFPNRRFTLTGHEKGVDRVAMLNDARTAVTAGLDHTVRLWDVEIGQPKGVLGKHDKPVRTVAADPKGMRAASASEDGVIRLWDVNARKEIRSWRSHAGIVWSVAFSPDGKRLVSGGDDHKVKVWNVDNGSLVKELVGHSAAVNQVAYMPNGKQVVSASWDKTARHWDVDSAKETCKYEGHTDTVQCINVSADGNRIATGSADKKVRLWTPGTPTPARVMESYGSVYAVAFTPNGQYVAAGGPEQHLRTFEVETGKILDTWRAHSDSIAGLAWRPDGRELVTASHDKTVNVWVALPNPKNP